MLTSLCERGHLGETKPEDFEIYAQLAEFDLTLPLPVFIVLGLLLPRRHPGKGDVRRLGAAIVSGGW